MVFHNEKKQLQTLKAIFNFIKFSRNVNFPFGNISCSLATFFPSVYLSVYFQIVLLKTAKKAMISASLLHTKTYCALRLLLALPFRLSGYPGNKCLWPLCPEVAHFHHDSNCWGFVFVPFWPENGAMDVPLYRFKSLRVLMSEHAGCEEYRPSEEKSSLRDRTLTTTSRSKQEVLCLKLHTVQIPALAFLWPCPPYSARSQLGQVDVPSWSLGFPLLPRP